uniref:Uncharacterized protein n=1 Tax=Aegilops tauschii subsp. strangulata TaxID=200361 RepID=A0A453KDJ4_AEGTS
MKIIGCDCKGINVAICNISVTMMLQSVRSVIFFVGFFSSRDLSGIESINWCVCTHSENQLLPTFVLECYLAFLSSRILMIYIYSER